MFFNTIAPHSTPHALDFYMKLRLPICLRAALLSAIIGASSYTWAANITPGTGSITLGAGDVLTSDTDAQQTGNITLTGDAFVSGAGNITIGTGATNKNSYIYGPQYTLTKQGTGTLIFNQRMWPADPLSQQNLFAGLIIDQGNVIFKTNDVFAGGARPAEVLPKVTINTGTSLKTEGFNLIGDLDINGGILTQTGLTGGWAGWQFRGKITSTGNSTITTESSGEMHLSRAGTLMDVQNGTLTVSASLKDGNEDAQGATSLLKQGDGTLTLTVKNTFSGGTIVEGGTLKLAYGGQEAAIRGTAVIRNGSTLELAAGDATGYGTGAGRLSNVILQGDSTMHVSSSSNQTLSNFGLTLAGGSQVTGIAGSNLDFFSGSSFITSLASAETNVISTTTLSLRQTDVAFNVYKGTTTSGIDLRLDSIVRDAIGGGGPYNLIKKGGGTLAWTKASTFASGALNIQGGTLLLDYNLADAALTTNLLGNGAEVIMGGGNMLIQGKDGAGNTLQEFEKLSTTASTFSSITLKGGVGTGTLTLDIAKTTAPNIGAGSVLVFHLGDRSNLISTQTPPAGLFTTNVIIEQNNNYGLATVNGTNVTQGTVFANVVTGGNNTTLYQAIGTQSLTGAVTAKGLYTRSTADGQSLTITGALAITGFGLYYSGEHDYTINVTGGSTGGPVIMDGKSTLSLNVNLGNSNFGQKIHLIDGNLRLAFLTNDFILNAGGLFTGGGDVTFANGRLNYWNAQTTGHTLSGNAYVGDGIVNGVPIATTLIIGNTGTGGGRNGDFGTAHITVRDSSILQINLGGGSGVGTGNNFNNNITLDNNSTLYNVDGHTNFGGNIHINAATGHVYFKQYWDKGLLLSGIISGSGEIRFTAANAEATGHRWALANNANTFDGTYVLGYNGGTGKTILQINAPRAAYNANIRFDKGGDFIDLSTAETLLNGNLILNANGGTSTISFMGVTGKLLTLSGGISTTAASSHLTIHDSGTVNFTGTAQKNIVGQLGLMASTLNISSHLSTTTLASGLTGSQVSTINVYDGAHVSIGDYIGASSATGRARSLFNIIGGTVNIGTGLLTKSGWGAGNLGEAGSNFSYMTVAGGTLNVTDTLTLISDGFAGLDFTGGVANINKLQGAKDAVNSKQARITLNGGKLHLGAGGLVAGTGSFTLTTYLTSGTLGALSNWSSSVDMIIKDQVEGTASNVVFNTALYNPTTETYSLAEKAKITLSGVISRNGNSVSGITVDGGGTLELTNTANTFVGGATLLNGTLSLAAEGSLGVAGGRNIYAKGANTGLSSSAATLSVERVELSANAGFYVGGSGSTLSLTTGHLSLATGGTGTLGFNIAGNQASALTVTNAFTLNSGLLIDVNIFDAVNGDYTVINSTNPFALNGQTITLDPNAANKTRKTLTLNQTGNTVSINVSGDNSATLAWAGSTTDNVWGASMGTDTWDTTAPNKAFIDGDHVQFNTLATDQTVLISGPVRPSSILINADNNYTFSAKENDPTANIIGITALTKQGTGTATINTINSFIGNTILEGGELVMGINSALGATGKILFNGGTLGFASGVNIDLSSRIDTASTDSVRLHFLDNNNISWANAVTQNLHLTGTGTLTLLPGATPSTQSFFLGAGSSLAINHQGIAGSFGTVYNLSGAGTLLLNAKGDATSNGNNTTVVKAANDFTGTIRLTGGMLSYSNGTFGQSPEWGQGKIELVSGGIGDGVQWVAGTVNYTITNDVELVGSTTFLTYGSSTATFTKAITGTSTGSATKSDGGHLVLGQGFSSNGAFYFKGGTTTFGGGISNMAHFSANSASIINISAGATVNATRFTLSDGGSTSATVNVTGTLNITGNDNSLASTASCLLAHWPAASTLNLKTGAVMNSLNAQVLMGWDNKGTINAETGTTMNLKGMNFGSARGDRGALKMADGSRLNIGSLGLAGFQANVEQIQLGHVTIGAIDDWAGGSTGVFHLTSNEGIIVNTEDALLAGVARTITLNAIIKASGTTPTVTGKLTKNGVGTLILNAANTYTGGTFINGGTLQLGNAGALSSGNIEIAGGTLDLNGFGITNAISLRGGLINNNATTAVTRAHNITTTGDYSLGGAGNLKITANVTGTGGLTKIGAGTVTLSGTNAGTGALAVQAGILTLDGAFTGLTSSNVADGATLNVNNTLATTGALTLNDSGTVNIGTNGKMTVASLTLGANQTLSVLGAFTTTGATGLTLAKDFTVTGTGVINGSVTVNDTVIYTLADATNKTFTGGTLNLVGVSSVLDSTRSGGILTMAQNLVGAGRVIINNTNGAQTLITGAEAGNTITGPILVNSGVFGITGASQSDITVADGATLRALGQNMDTFAKTITMNGNSIFSIGSRNATVTTNKLNNIPNLTIEGGMSLTATYTNGANKYFNQNGILTLLGFDDQWGTLAFVRAAGMPAGNWEIREFNDIVLQSGTGQITLAGDNTSFYLPGNSWVSSAGGELVFNLVSNLTTEQEIYNSISVYAPDIYKGQAFQHIYLSIDGNMSPVMVNETTGKLEIITIFDELYPSTDAQPTKSYMMSSAGAGPDGSRTFNKNIDINRLTIYPAANNTRAVINPGFSMKVNSGYIDVRETGEFALSGGTLLGSATRGLSISVMSKDARFIVYSTTEDAGAAATRVVKRGDGTLTLAGEINNKGGLDVQRGTLQLTGRLNGQNAGAAALINVRSAGKLLLGDGQSNFVLNYANNSIINEAGGVVEYTLNSKIDLAKVQINDGTLRLNIINNTVSQLTTALGGNGKVEIASGTLNNTLAQTQSFNILTDATLKLTGSATYTANHNTITGTGSVHLSNDGTGVFDFGATTNTYSGGTLLSKGLIAWDTAQGSSALGTGTITIGETSPSSTNLNITGAWLDSSVINNAFILNGLANNGTNLSFNHTNRSLLLNGNISLQGAGRLLLDAATAANSEVTLAGKISGTGSLNLASAGDERTFILSNGANNFTGGLNSTARLKLGAAGTTLGLGTVNLGAGSVLDLNGYSVAVSGITSAGSTITNTKGASKGELTLGQAGAVQGASNFTLGGAITQTAADSTVALNKVGNNTMILALTGNQSSGGFNIKQGTVRVQANQIMGQGNTITVFDGATLNMNNFSSGLIPAGGAPPVLNPTANTLVLQAGSTLEGASNFYDKLKVTGATTTVKNATISGSAAMNTLSVGTFGNVKDSKARLVLRASGGNQGILANQGNLQVTHGGDFYLNGENINTTLVSAAGQIDLAGTFQLFFDTNANFNGANSLTYKLFGGRAITSASNFNLDLGNADFLKEFYTLTTQSSNTTINATIIRKQMIAHLITPADIAPNGAYANGFISADSSNYLGPNLGVNVYFDKNYTIGSTDNAYRLTNGLGWLNMATQMTDSAGVGTRLIIADYTAGNHIADRGIILSNNNNRYTGGTDILNVHVVVDGSTLAGRGISPGVVNILGTGLVRMSGENAILSLQAGGTASTDAFMFNNNFILTNGAVIEQTANANTLRGNIDISDYATISNTRNNAQALTLEGKLTGNQLILNGADGTNPTNTIAMKTGVLDQTTASSLKKLYLKDNLNLDLGSLVSLTTQDLIIDKTSEITINKGAQFATATLNGEGNILLNGGELKALGNLFLGEAGVTIGINKISSPATLDNNFNTNGYTITLLNGLGANDGSFAVTGTGKLVVKKDASYFTETINVDNATLELAKDIKFGDASSSLIINNGGTLSTEENVKLFSSVEVKNGGNTRFGQGTVLYGNSIIRVENGGTYSGFTQGKSLQLILEAGSRFLIHSSDINKMASGTYKSMVEAKIVNFNTLNGQGLIYVSGEEASFDGLDFKKTFTIAQAESITVNGADIKRGEDLSYLLGKSDYMWISFGLSAELDPTTIYDSISNPSYADSLVMSINRDVNFSLIAQTGNEKALSPALSYIGGNYETMTGSIAEFGKALGNIKMSEAKAALSSISESVSSVLSGYNAQKEQLRRHTFDIRDKAQWETPSALRFAHDKEYSNIWASGIASTYSLDSEGDQLGSTATVWGGTLGTSKAFSENLVMGIGFSYSSSKVNVEKGMGDATSDATSIDLFARYNKDNWNITGVLTGGMTEMSSTRHMSLPGYSSTTKGKADGSQINALVEAGYQFALDEKKASYIEPFALVSAGYSSLDSFSETGAGNAGLQVQSQSDTLSTLGVGTRYVTEFNMPKSEQLLKGRWESRVMILQDLTNNDISVDGHFIGAPNNSFSVKGATPGKTAFAVGTGVVLPVATQVSVFGDVNAEFRSSQSSINANVGVKIEF